MYVLFGDAEKCFDKLWLDDCLNEVYMINVNLAEISLIEKMNSDIKAIRSHSPVTLNVSYLGFHFKKNLGGAAF